MMMGSARCSPDSCDYFVHRAVALTGRWPRRVYSQMLGISPEACLGASLVEGACFRASLVEGAGGVGAVVMSPHSR